MSLEKFIVWVVIIIVFLIIIAWEPIFHLSDEYCKAYIIKHAKDIHKGENSDSIKPHYKLPYKGFYYTDITIKLESDSSYKIVFWGNRNSWLWQFKLDRYFTVDVDYNEYKVKDIEQDLIILSLLKAQKK